MRKRQKFPKAFSSHALACQSHGSECHCITLIFSISTLPKKVVCKYKATEKVQSTLVRSARPLLSDNFSSH